MKKSKDRTCMCSHKKSEHEKNIIHISTVCNICQCHSYMKNDKPLLIDKINLFYGLIMIGVFSILFVDVSLFIFGLDSMMYDDHLKLLEIIDGHENNIFLIILVFFTLLCNLLFDSLISSYFYIQKRKKHSKV